MFTFAIGGPDPEAGSGKFVTPCARMQLANLRKAA
jgi:hypothetical protein